MRRASIERARTVRVWRAHQKTVHSDDDSDSAGCVCELQPGRFRKGQRIGGCRKPRCYLCKYDKLTGEPTRQELRIRATEHDWLQDRAPATKPASRSTDSAARGRVALLRLMQL